MQHQFAGPAFSGGLLALLAAVLFGLSTPLLQRWGVGVGVFASAALLYVGAALAGLLLRQPAHKEARLRRSDLPRIACMAGIGAVIGPVALAWGLQRTHGASASLMLTLEALFTVLLARLLYAETMDKRVWTAMGLLLLGGAALVLDRGLSGAVQLLGLLAVLAATLAWGLDNTLSRGVAERDPGQVVLAKSALGASLSATMAWAWGESMPSLVVGLLLAALGALGYGLSLRFYLLAQRAFGAARTGSVFAFAPFIGMLGAFALGDRTASGFMILGGGLMLAGVVLHLAEAHEHGHTHEALAHEHAHTHNDGHHLHAHDPAQQGVHSHMHQHAPVRHKHPHVPDAHHLHPH